MTCPLLSGTHLILTAFAETFIESLAFIYTYLYVPVRATLYWLLIPSIKVAPMLPILAVGCAILCLLAEFEERRCAAEERKNASKPDASDGESDSDDSSEESGSKSDDDRCDDDDDTHYDDDDDHYYDDGDLPVTTQQPDANSDAHCGLGGDRYDSDLRTATRPSNQSARSNVREGCDAFGKISARNMIRLSPKYRRYLDEFVKYSVERDGWWIEWCGGEDVKADSEVRDADGYLESEEEQQQGEKKNDENYVDDEDSDEEAEGSEADEESNDEDAESSAAPPKFVRRGFCSWCEASA